MAEKETIFSSNIKYGGIFPFPDFYKFCYEWLTEEMGLSPVAEDKYVEKLDGNEKEITIEWTGSKKVTDYFKFEVKVKFEVKGLIEVEINQGNAKIKTNKGTIKLIVKGILIRDYQGKFEKTAYRKFLRSIYEKWIITSRIDQMEEVIAGDCDEFLNQAKAYLDLEGKK